MRKKSRRTRKPTRAQQLAALRAESERELVEKTRGQLAVPSLARTNFLRVRTGLIGSHL